MSSEQEFPVFALATIERLFKKWAENRFLGVADQFAEEFVQLFHDQLAQDRLVNEAAGSYDWKFHDVITALHNHSASDSQSRRPSAEQYEGSQRHQLDLALAQIKAADEALDRAGVPRDDHSSEADLSLAARIDLLQGYRENEAADADTEIERLNVSPAYVVNLEAALSGIVGPAARCLAGRHGHMWERLREAIKVANAALSSPRPGAEGAEPVAADIAALIDYHKQECCRYEGNGNCSVRRCNVRGGWTPGNPGDWSKATCEAHETVVALQSLAKAPAGAGEARVRELGAALEGLINAVCDDGDHGFGADDADCPICRAVATGQAALAAAEPQDMGGR